MWTERGCLPGVKNLYLRITGNMVGSASFLANQVGNKNGNHRKWRFNQITAGLKPLCSYDNFLKVLEG